MHDRCSATNIDGSPCSARPHRDGYCRWHHPDLKAENRANAIKGGKARSNQARARKALGGVQDLAICQKVLMQSIAKVYNGEMEPADAQAIASLARAVVHVSGAADLEARIAEIEEVAERMRQVSA